MGLFTTMKSVDREWGQLEIKTWRTWNGVTGSEPMVLVGVWDREFIASGCNDLFLAFNRGIAF